MPSGSQNRQDPQGPGALPDLPDLQELPNPQDLPEIPGPLALQNLHSRSSHHVHGRRETPPGPLYSRTPPYVPDDVRSAHIFNTNRI